MGIVIVGGFRLHKLCLLSAASNFKFNTKAQNLFVVAAWNGVNILPSFSCFFCAKTIYHSKAPGYTGSERVRGKGTHLPYLDCWCQLNKLLHFRHFFTALRWTIARSIFFPLLPPRHQLFSFFTFWQRDYCTTELSHDRHHFHSASHFPSDFNLDYWSLQFTDEYLNWNETWLLLIQKKNCNQNISRKHKKILRILFSHPFYYFTSFNFYNSAENSFWSFRLAKAVEENGENTENVIPSFITD